MSTLTLKIIGGTAALGSLGTAGYFGVRELLKTPTIEEVLSSESFKFISFENDEQWKAEFDSDSDNIKSKLGATVNSGKALRDKCKSMMQLDSVKNKLDIESVKEWCGFRSISSQLERNKKKLLVGLTESGIDEKWTATIDKRKSTSADRTKVGLTGNWEPANTGDKDKVKSWCAKESKKDFLVKEESYKLVEAWCTEQGASITEIR